MGCRGKWLSNEFPKRVSFEFVSMRCRPELVPVEKETEVVFRLVVIPYCYLFVVNSVDLVALMANSM